MERRGQEVGSGIDPATGRQRLEPKHASAARDNRVGLGEDAPQHGRRHEIPLEREVGNGQDEPREVSGPHELGVEERVARGRSRARRELNERATGRDVDTRGELVARRVLDHGHGHSFRIGSGAGGPR